MLRWASIGARRELLSSLCLMQAADDSVGWTPEMQNEEMFRVIEYGAM